METAPIGSYAGYSSGGTSGNISTDFTSSFLPDGVSHLSVSCLQEDMRSLS